MARERAASFATLSEQKRKQAMARFVVLRPHLEEGVPLTCAAAAAGVPLRTAQRWLARYRQDGSTGLAGSIRRDAGRHRSPADLVALIEGMGLKKPRSSAAAILWHGPCHPRSPRPSHGDAGTGRSGRLSRPLRADPPPSRRNAQCALASRPHAARHPHSRRSRKACPSLAHDRHRRPFPCGHRVHGIPRRTVRAQHLSRPAPRDLAQGRPCLAGLRHPGRALR